MGTADRPFVRSEVLSLNGSHPASRGPPVCTRMTNRETSPGPTDYAGKACSRSQWHAQIVREVRLFSRSTLLVTVENKGSRPSVCYDATGSCSRWRPFSRLLSFQFKWNQTSSNAFPNHWPHSSDGDCSAICSDCREAELAERAPGDRDSSTSLCRPRDFRCGRC